MWLFKKPKEGEQQRSSLHSPSVIGRRGAASPVFQEVSHPFKQRFDLEVESWCFGLERLKENPLPQVVFQVVRELRPLFAEAIEKGFAFDIQIVAEKLYFAAKKTIPRKELLFALLAILPDPEALAEAERRVFTVVVAQVEVTEGGAVERVRQRWSLGNPNRRSIAASPVRP